MLKKANKDFYMLRPLVIAFSLVAAMPALAETRVPQTPAEIRFGFAPLVKEAAPAVVNIYAKRIVQERQSLFTSDPFFDQFFRGFGESQPKVQNSLGSGVILSDDGIVVSNYHVVGMSTDIRVQLKDRREYKARVLLADEESDLAILQMEDANTLPFLKLRNSDTVEVGELVLAIGNPFGVGQTVTSGIVSGLARSGVSTGNSRGYFLQTDAAINPGNSGGALVDVNGELIGINTSILTRSGGSNGIGFAIPARLVGEFVNQAREGYDEFRRPWAGMFGQPVDADMADGLGLDRPGGIIVSDLHPESPFLAAGLEASDVILEVDGLPVNTPAEMVFRMSVAGLGNQASVLVAREGEVTSYDVDLGSAPENPPRHTIEAGRKSAIPGVVMSNINAAVVWEFNLPFNIEGVVVETPGAVGSRLGLRAGDVLRVIDGEEVSSTKEADHALRNASKRLTLEVQRGTQRVVMRIRL
jgi:Do/DeqQ family serine protease